MQTVGSYNKIERAIDKEGVLKLYSKIEVIEKNLKRTNELLKEKNLEIDKMLSTKVNLYELNILEERKETLEGSIKDMFKTLAGLYKQFNELYYEKI
jgi:hypothetical protein